MADCDMLKGCVFFNDKMPETKGVGALYKQRFCLDDSSKCARYIVAKTLGRDKVPSNLYPNMLEKAEQLIGRPSS